MTLAAFVFLASLALSNVEARRITHSGRLFRKSILDVQNGEIVIQNQNPPKSWTLASLEPYNEYHFRFEAIGCNDVTKDSEFFTTCCKPRPVDKAADSLYPAACNIAAYLIEQPIFDAKQGVAKLAGHDGGDGTSVATSTSEESVTENSAHSSSSSSTKSESTSSAPVSTSSSASSTTSSTAWGSIVAGAAFGQAETTTTSPKHSPLSSPVSSPAITPEKTPDSAPESTPFTTSTTPEWTPEPSPEVVKSTSSTSAEQPATTPSYNGETYHGTATWFTQNGNPGACGVYNSDSTPLVALDYRMYGNMGVKSQYCGRTVTITNTETGAQVTALVQDACPSCVSSGSLDLSIGAFQAIAPLSNGVAPISWHFN